MENHGCYLPEGIVEDILVRLPTKTLLKYKIVSKSWKSLIESSSFKRLHEQKSLENPILLLLSLKDDPNIRYIECVLTTVDLSGAVLDEWDLPPIGLRNYTMLPSPSGPHNLVCFIVDSQRFVVCNPSTRQICSPEPDAADSSSTLYFPSYITHAGFGYLHSRKQYFIVSKFDDYNDWRMITFSRDVFVGNTFEVDSSWKTIEDSERYGVDASFEGIFANGVLYWAGDADGRMCLTCFDLSDERFFLVLLPDEIESSASYDDRYWLVELNGDLHLVYKRAEEEQNVELWRLDDGHWRWSKQDMCVTRFRDHFGSLNSQFTPVMMNGDGEMLVYNGGFMEWYKLLEEKGCKRIPRRGYVLDFKLHIDAPFI